MKQTRMASMRERKRSMGLRKSFKRGSKRRRHHLNVAIPHEQQPWRVVKYGQDTGS